MKAIKKILSIVFCSLLAISYSQFGFANSKEYLSKWYEYTLQKAGKEIIDEATIDEIADHLTNDKRPIHSLIVDNNNLSPNALEKLLNALKTNSTIRNLSFYDFNGKDIAKITGVLETEVLNYRKGIGFVWINDLNFINNRDDISVNIDLETAKNIANIIKAGLNSLDLSGYDLNNQCVAEISSSLLETDKLTSLSLNRDNLNDAGAMKIANILPKINRLEKLSLNGNKIGLLGVISLGRALKNCNSYNSELTKLSLDDNNIDCDGIVTIIEDSSKINDLSIAGNNIGSDCAMKLVPILAKHKFNNFNLDRNNIGSTSAVAIANILWEDHCSYYSPQNTLSLARNDIDSNGVTKIANVWKQALNSNLNLNGNNVGSTGAVALIKAALTQKRIDGLSLDMIDIEDRTATTSEKHSEL